MARIGVISISNGRDYVGEGIADFIRANEDKLVAGLTAAGHSARSADPAENLTHVHLYPEVFFFPAGGASVHHLAAPGEMTLGSFEMYDTETNLALMKQSTPEWPHAFARLDASADDFLSRFGANHIHAVPGDIRPAVGMACGLLGSTLDEFTRG